MKTSQNIEDYVPTGKPPVIKVVCDHCTVIRDNNNEGDCCPECGSWEISKAFICEEVKLKTT